VGRKVRYDCDGDVGIITLDSPPLNLFEYELINDLIAALEEAEGDMLRALLIRAEGKVFTGGVDVKVFDDKTPAQAASLFNELLAITHKLEDMPWPTIASVQGLCLTAGFELALGCDLIWAGESARFGLVEIVVGLTPAMGGTQRVAERAGPARARELVMTGDLYDAAALERWNVVNRVLPDGELADASLDLARRLADQGERGHQARGPRVPRGRRARRRREGRGDSRLAVRHRGPAERGRHLPGAGPGQGDVQQPLARSPVPDPSR
jgi:enoyl-CoA hydratase/carnithine racemase